MKCETCGKAMESVRCPKCEAVVAKIGTFCYLCGGALGEETDEVRDTAAIDFEDRILCSDGTCIGVINEQGICKVCGKPYKQET